MLRILGVVNQIFLGSVRTGGALELHFEPSVFPVSSFPCMFAKGCGYRSVVRESSA